MTSKELERQLGPQYEITQTLKAYQIYYHLNKGERILLALIGPRETVIYPYVLPSRPFKLIMKFARQRVSDRRVIDDIDRPINTNERLLSDLKKLKAVSKATPGAIDPNDLAKFEFIVDRVVNQNDSITHSMTLAPYHTKHDIMAPYQFFAKIRRLVNPKEG